MKGQRLRLTAEMLKRKFTDLKLIAGSKKGRSLRYIHTFSTTFCFSYTIQFSEISQASQIPALALNNDLASNS